MIARGIAELDTRYHEEAVKDAGDSLLVSVSKKGDSTVVTLERSASSTEFGVLLSARWTLLPFPLLVAANSTAWPGLTLATLIFWVIVLKALSKPREVQLTIDRPGDLLTIRTRRMPPFRIIEASYPLNSITGVWLRLFRRNDDEPQWVPIPEVDENLSQHLKESQGNWFLRHWYLWEVGLELDEGSSVFLWSHREPNGRQMRALASTLAASIGTELVGPTFS